MKTDKPKPKDVSASFLLSKAELRTARRHDMAKAALQGMLASFDAKALTDVIDDADTMEGLCIHAYRFADAMLKAGGDV